MLEHLDTMIGFAVVMLIMSLVVTILVQVVQTVTDLRGRNLVWGVERILEDLGYHQPRQYAERLLRHPSVAAGRRRAEAIRSSELGLLLTRLAEMTPEEERPDRLKRLGSWIARTLGLDRFVGAMAARMGYRAPVEEPLGETVRNAATSIADGLKALEVAETQTVEAAERAVRERLEAARAELDEFANNLEDELEQRVTAAHAKVDDLKETFDMVMDRTTQRFVAQTRLFTVAVAFVLAFALQLDTLKIYDQISTDAELRATLVANSAAVLQQAENVQADLDVPLATRAIEAMPGALAGADSEMLARVDTTGVAALLPRLTDPPPGLIRRSEGRNWIRGRITDEAPDPAVDLYEDVFGTIATGQLTTLLGHADALRDGADGRLELFERSGDFSDLWVQRETPSSRLPAWLPAWPVFTRHFYGVLLSALLLSLGAPFWFNGLKNLSNLRPVLAGRVDTDERKSK